MNLPINWRPNQNCWESKTQPKERTKWLGTQVFQVCVIWLWVSRWRHPIFMLVVFSNLTGKWILFLTHSLCCSFWASLRQPVLTFAVTAKLEIVENLFKNKVLKTNLCRMRFPIFCAVIVGDCQNTWSVASQQVLFALLLFTFSKFQKLLVSRNTRNYRFYWWNWKTIQYIFRTSERRSQNECNSNIKQKAFSIIPSPCEKLALKYLSCIRVKLFQHFVCFHISIEIWVKSRDWGCVSRSHYALHFRLFAFFPDKIWHKNVSNTDQKIVDNIRIRPIFKYNMICRRINHRYFLLWMEMLTELFRHVS